MNTHTPPSPWGKRFPGGGLTGVKASAEWAVEVRVADGLDRGSLPGMMCAYWIRRWWPRSARASTVFLLVSWAFCLRAPAQTNGPVTNRPTSLRAFEGVVPGREFIERNRSVLSFGLDKVELLQGTLLGKPLWQYLAFTAYLILAFVLSNLLDRFINHRVKQWAARTATHWDDILVGLVDGPVKVITFVLLLHLGLQIFDWPVWLEGWISRLTLLTVFFSVTYVMLKTVDALIGVAKTRLAPGGDRAFNEQFLVVCGKALKAVLVTVAILTLFSNFGVNITAVLGSLSVLGLALGLAAQDTVANLFGAVAVFVDKPFQLGDRIQIGAIDGTVEEMGLRATQVRTADGYLVTVPNKTVGSNTVVNVSRRPSIKTDLLYQLAANTPTARVQRAVEILNEVFRAHPKTCDLIVTFDRLTDSALILKVMHWWGDTDGRANLMGILDLNLQVKERLDAEGIPLAGADRTVWLLRDAQNPQVAPKM